MTHYTIPQHLLDAYQSAEYHVDAVQPFMLKIGIYSHELKYLLESSKQKCAAFITAYNPGSIELPEEINQARNQKLEALIQSMGYSYLHGVGQCVGDHWAGEASLLILGMDKDTASEVGKQVEQNAIVWCADDAVPQLVLLK